MKLYGSRTLEDIPGYRIKWKRYRKESGFNWDKANITLSLGIKGSGKSLFGEFVGLHHKKIFDFFGSRDNESLFWCRKGSPIDDILLVHSPSVEVNAPWDTIPSDKLSLSKMMEYETVTTCDRFFLNQVDRFKALEDMIAQCWNRYGFTYPIAIIIREASSFLYSRMKLEGADQKSAKSDFIYFQREMRHMGFTLAIDTIRWTSIDKEMRDLADYLIIKNLGYHGLPSDLSWIYQFYDPKKFSIMNPPNFVVLNHYGGLGYGDIENIPYHKPEGLDIVKELGIEIEYFEALTESTDQQVGDKEHEKIIKLYGGGKSYENIANEIKRGLATVSRHIKRHDKNVNNLGYCPICRRVDGEYQAVDMKAYRTQ